MLISNYLIFTGFFCYQTSIQLGQPSSSMAEGTDLVCHFKNLLTDLIPAKFKTSCSGRLVKIEECQKPVKDEMMEGDSEWELILLRSGYLKQYDEQKGWHICEGHRSSFGFAFVKHLKQHTSKCLYPNHTGKQNPIHRIGFKRSRDLLLKADMIIPCGVKVCPTCSHKITEKLNRFATVPDREKKSCRKNPMSLHHPKDPRKFPRDTSLGDLTLTIMKMIHQVVPMYY